MLNKTTIKIISFLQNVALLNIKLLLSLGNNRSQLKLPASSKSCIWFCCHHQEPKGKIARKCAVKPCIC